MPLAKCLEAQPTPACSMTMPPKASRTDKEIARGFSRGSQCQTEAILRRTGAGVKTNALRTMRTEKKMEEPGSTLHVMARLSNWFEPAK